MANKPNNPSLWSKAKSLAKQKFDVYPSAYANGWAAKWYKSHGGSWRKAEYGMQIPYMEDGGKPEWLIEAQLKAQGYSGNALQQKMNSMAQGGEKMTPEIARARFAAAGNLDKLDDYGYAYGGYIPEMAAGGWAQQAAIAIAMKKAGKKPKSMKDGGDPDGGMALGQIDATIEKLQKLRQFIQPDSDLEPWVNSKLTLMDDYSAAVSDYMTHNPEAHEEMKEPQGLPMEEMRDGGIPQRYKNMGFTHVGQKKQGDGKHKWKVLAKKGDQYKVVQGGWRGMQDFSQHHSEKRKERFWDRMGGRNSSKATDPFSPLYWHKRFGTWQNGGQAATYKPLSQEELSALAHQFRGMGDIFFSNEPYIAEHDAIKNELGYLTPRERQQLYKYMNAQSGLQKAWEFLPNLLGGSGSAALPKNSRLKDSMRSSYFTGENGYKNWLNYMESKGYKDGGESEESNFSGNAWYKMGGMPCYECGGMYAYGGIHLDPKKKGTFKAQATKMGMSTQEAAAHILANKEDYSPAMVKKANFARNFAKQNGGLVEGSEMEVTPEQAEMLRQQGYQFEII